MLSRILEAYVQVLLNFRDGLEIIGYLEPLHIFDSLVRKEGEEENQDMPWTILASL